VWRNFLIVFCAVSCYIEDDMMDPQTDLLRRLESGYSLPALSVVAIRLVELASDEESSVKDLVSLIEKDPSLAVRLLKISNSAFFKTVEPATTLQQAVIRIGFQQLRIMALSLSLRDTFPMGTEGGFDYERFWRASLYRALMAKSLAEHAETCNPEEAFVAGLTLGVGFLIFFAMFIKGSGEGIGSGLDSLEKLLAWEQERFGVNHREVGAAALRYWKFPDSIIVCQAGYLHHPGSSPLSKVCELARIMSISLLGRSKDFQELFRDGKEWFGLGENVINAVILSVFQEVDSIAESLKIEMNKEKDLLGLMEKANHALSGISAKISMMQMQGGGAEPPSFDTIKEGQAGQDVITNTLQAVAHEIRNPLVAVAGFARKLSSTLDPESKGGKYAQIILQEAQRLEEALNQMKA
jgi:HD-like signal output (HDOD) protein